MTHSSPTAVRCYRYALRPTPEQARAIAHAQAQARRLWNEMVSLLKYAEREQRNGRREALIHEYGRILAGKLIVAGALTKARRLMADRGLASVEEATAIARAEKVEAARKYSHRLLAVNYAVERVQATARNKQLIFSAQTVVTIVRKFGDACVLYVTGKRGAPKFKTSSDSISLQRQVDVHRPMPVSFTAATVDLAAMLGAESCRAMPAILHRRLPVGATIKQIAVSTTAARAFVIFMFEAPATSCMRAVPVVDPTAVAGVDPGRKTALSVSDADGETQFCIQPPTLKNARAERRHRRLLRKASRQLRLANSGCFSAKGQWKKKGNVLKITAGLRKTRARINENTRHFQNTRREAYHLAVNRLLNEFSVVGIGTWRGRGDAVGFGKSRRAQNRKDRSNAISEFTGILKDKAARCSQPRTVLDVWESGTTKNCPDCGAATGPSGLKDLKVRAWTCSACGANHQRDFASARAIARRAQQTAAGAHPAQPEAQASNPAVASTKVRVRKVRAKSPLPRKKASISERRSGVSAMGTARAGNVVGVEVVERLAPCSQPPNHHQMELPLAGVDATRSYRKRRHELRRFL